MNTVEDKGTCCVCDSVTNRRRYVMNDEEAAEYEIENGEDRTLRFKESCTVCNYASFNRSDCYMLQIGEDQFSWYRGKNKPTEDINEAIEINRAFWISMHPEEKAFLLARAADPHDMVTCKVFADWLDEHDRPEEADGHRKWTSERQESKDWLRGFAEDLCMSYEFLMEITRENYTKGQYHDGYCLPFDTPDRVYDESELFWRHYETVTGQQLSGRDDTFFRCAC